MHLSEEELERQLEEAAGQVEVGALYSHFRRMESRYRVLSLVMIEATQEPGVIYQKEQGTIIWMRPLKEWIELVEGGGTRFQKITGVYSS